MSESQETIPREHVELLSRIIKLESKLEGIAEKLDKIVIGLEKVVLAHNSTKTAVEGYGQTIKRHEEEHQSIFKRLRFLEKAYWMAIGGIGLLNIILLVFTLIQQFK